MSRLHASAQWIGTVLLVILAFIALDTLFQLLGANPDNVIVSFVAAVAGIFLAPFMDMFPEQQYLLTALIAILGWSLLAAVIVAIIHNIAASRSPDRTGSERVVEREIRHDAGPPESQRASERDQPTRRL